MPVAQNAINEISQFTSDIRFLAGKSNAVADWLSRPPDVPIGTAYALPAAEESIGTIAAVEEDLSLELISHKALAAAQDVCPEVLRHRQGQCPKSVTMSNIEFSPGVHLYCDTSTGTNRPLVPAAFRPTIMAMFHQVAHCAKAESIRKVSHRYYWPNLRSDVATYVSQCQSCQATQPFKAIRPPVKSIPVPQQRFSSLQVDVVGPMPVSEGMRYLLTIFDRTTR